MKHNPCCVNETWLVFCIEKWIMFCIETWLMFRIETHLVFRTGTWLIFSRNMTAQVIKCPSYIPHVSLMFRRIMFRTSHSPSMHGSSLRWKRNEVRTMIEPDAVHRDTSNIVFACNFIFRELWFCRPGNRLECVGRAVTDVYMSTRLEDVISSIRNIFDVDYN